MKCSNCGFEFDNNLSYCPNCGTEAKKEQAAPEPIEQISLNPAGDVVMGILKNKKFLAICILMTVSCVLALISTGIPIITTIITIFLWIMYSDAGKGIVDGMRLRVVSGAVYANYVVINVASIILIVCGLLMGVAFGMVSGADTFIEIFEQAMQEAGLDASMFDFLNLSEEMLAIAGLAISVGIILIAVVALIFNIIGMRSIHRFVKSTYQGILYQNTNFANPISAKNWLMFYGVCMAISAATSLVTDVTTALSNGCSAAATIMASGLINQYFVMPAYKHQ